MIQPIQRSFRELVRLIHRLPRAERDAALIKAKEEMIKHSEACDEEVADLHRTLVSKICFLRMKVPKHTRDASAVGVGHYVVREGKVVEGRGKILEPSIGAGLNNEEAYRKHRQLMKRQYFGEDPPRYSEML